MNPFVRIFVHQCSMFISIILHFSLSLYCFSILFSFIAFCHSNPSPLFSYFPTTYFPINLLTSYLVLHHLTFHASISFPPLSLLPSLTLSLFPSLSIRPCHFLSFSLTISLSSYSLDNLYPLQLFIWEHLRKIYGTFRRVECR